jgi:mannose-6-phosphate isomerase-like protein (cupin superfamily)
MPLQFKRVVTAHNSAGRSFILYDAQPETEVVQPGRALTFFELWETDGPLASNEGTDDAGNRTVRHHPPVGGTRFRMVELMPDELRQDDVVAKDFEQLDADSIQTSDSDDPTMHRNETVDYNIVLSGEVYAVTEEEETLLRAGDVLIQRGTAHTWHNRSDVPCVFASVMVSASPLSHFSSNNEEALDHG